MENSRCMKCGCITYEGRHICLTCEGTDDMQTFKRQKMPPKTNRDKLSQVDMHDLLCRMQKNGSDCVIEQITGKPQDERCEKHESGWVANCQVCIAAWLNERSE